METLCSWTMVYGVVYGALFSITCMADVGPIGTALEDRPMYRHISRTHYLHCRGLLFEMGHSFTYSLPMPRLLLPAASATFHLSLSNFHCYCVLYSMLCVLYSITM